MKVSCFECHGKGMVSCDCCNGTGIHKYLNTFNYPSGRVCEEECTNCSGRGEVVCPVCDGAGKIDDGFDD